MIQYTWRVVQNNRFVGYVVAISEYDAIRKATKKFGERLWVERISQHNGPIV